MNSNHFSKRMSEKSDSELKDIISENSPYTDDAINAAIWEMDKRLNQKPEKALPKIESIVLKKNQIADKKEIKKEDNYSFFESEKYIFDDPTLPELYTKNFIFFISFFFGILFGSFFLMSNLRTIGLKQKGYFVLSFGVLLTILSISTFYLFNNYIISFFINLIGLLMINGFFWDNYIGKEFRHRRKKIIFI